VVVARGAAVALGALVGGFGTAVAVYLPPARRGVSGPRLILIGIGVSAMLYALNNYLISRRAALPAAQAWLVGGLDDRGPGHAVAVGVALAVLVPIVLALGRRSKLSVAGSGATSV